LVSKRWEQRKSAREKIDREILEKQTAEKSLQHPPDGRKIMGGQGHDIEKGCQRETSLCFGCIGSRTTEGAAPSEFSVASQNKENTRLLLPRQGS
jgi:hypothetical protein